MQTGFGAAAQRTSRHKPEYRQNARAMPVSQVAADVRDLSGPAGPERRNGVGPAAARSARPRANARGRRGNPARASWVRRYGVATDSSCVIVVAISSYDLLGTTSIRSAPASSCTSASTC